MTEIRDFEFTLTRRRWTLPSRRVVAHVRRGPQSTVIHAPSEGEAIRAAARITRAWFGPDDSLRLWDGITEAFHQMVSRNTTSLSLEVPR